MTLDDYITPAVLVAIATGIVTTLQFKKGNSLKHITEERKQWRTEIRAIMVELENSPNSRKNIQQIQRISTKIKGRINAYGLNPSKSYKQDYHIWQIIKQLEKPTDNTLKYDKQLLINSLALLLKADWERSKNEIEGDTKNHYNNIMILFSVIIFANIIFNEFNITKTINNMFSREGVVPLLYLGFSSIIFIWVWYGPSKLKTKLLKKQRTKIDNCKLKQEEIKSAIKRSTWCHLYLPILLFSIITLIQIARFETEYKVIIFSSVLMKTILIFMLWVISNISKFEHEKNKFIDKQEYYFSINDLLINRNNYLKPVDDEHSIKIPAIDLFE